MPAPYTGGCQCGSVRYVLTAEPIRVTACHCTECQRQSGSAFSMSMPVRKEGLSVTGSTKQFATTAAARLRVCSALIAASGSTMF